MHSRRGVAMLGITLFFGVTLVPNAQSQSDSQGYEKWLDCDVDWIFNRETVGPSFSLKVSFHGAPIAESRITLNKDGKAEATARTNDRGVARFEGLAPGKYDPESADGLLFPSGSLEIVVKSDHVSGEKLKLDWPGHSIASRNLRGRFNTSEDLSGPEIPLRAQSSSLGTHIQRTWLNRRAQI